MFVRVFIFVPLTVTSGFADVNVIVKPDISLLLPLRTILAFAPTVVVLILTGFFVATPIIRYGEQLKYKDKVIFDHQSRYQKIVITQWKSYYWLFINGNQQLSSLDEVMYHEPMVHSVMNSVDYPQQVLILGGGDGCAAREVLKYKQTEQITLVDLDPEMTNLGKHNPILVDMNKNALNDKRVIVINQDAYKYLSESNSFFDVIIVDLPDPKTVELGRLYTKEFYSLCNRHLRGNGAMITQAGSPYFATKAFDCINVSMKAAGFNIVPLHNQVITLGEWGWILGVKNRTSEELVAHLQSLKFDTIKTKWLNNESMKLITSFGKKQFFNPEKVKINKINDPVLYKYYLNGNWDLY